MSVADTEKNQLHTEILNRRKFYQALSGRWWQMLIGALVFAALFAGGTFTVKHVLFPEKFYQSESSIYVEFVKGENEPIGWVCYTLTAWEIIFKSDDFEADILSEVPGLTKEKYEEILQNSLVELADGRVLRFVIKDTDETYAKAVNLALLHAIAHFGESVDRIAYTKVLTAPQDAKPVLREEKTLQAGIFGFIAGFILTGIGLAFALLQKEEMYMLFPLPEQRK